MINKIKYAIAEPKVIIIIFLIFGISASIQSLMMGPTTFNGSSNEYTAYNNYKIFKHSFFHLRNGQDLYSDYPKEHWDLYKYSPTFSTFFGLFAIFPDWLGLSLWNILNAFLLLVGIYLLPKLTRFQKGLILIISVIELMTSLQNEQSNAMIAGLIIIAFSLLERRHYALATLCIISSAYVKLFGIVSFALFLFYPQKWKLATYSLIWIAILLVIPLLFVDLSQLQFLYSSWANLLSIDHSDSYGFSVMGWLYSWFGVHVNKFLVAGIGAIIFMIPFTRIRQYSNYKFRLLGLTSTLIWVVIFNHKAESPTFILAMAGIAIWFVISDKNYGNIALFVLAMVFTSLSPTDLFPPYLKKEFIWPYAIKAVPCILIWCKVIYEMITLNENFGHTEQKSNHFPSPELQ